MNYSVIYTTILIFLIYLSYIFKVKRVKLQMSISVIFLSVLRVKAFFKRHLFIVKDCRSDVERAEKREES